MNITVGICCYNENKNIASLLDNILLQKSNKVQISEIIVVSSGSTDGTDEIVNSYSRKDRRIKLIIEKRRKGKFSAINKIMKHAKSGIILMESADTIPNKNTFEILCSHLENKEAGIVGGKPVPLDKKTGFMPFFSKLKWDMHHKMSLIKPKFGEIIAFRNVVNKLEETAADEEEIASIIKGKGHELIYEPRAVVYNKGPETFSELIEQRRRAYASHLELKKRNEWSASTLSTFSVAITAIKNKDILLRNPFYLLLAFFIEIYGRILGRLDYTFSRKHTIWKTCPSTKFLATASGAGGRSLKDAFEFPAHLYKNEYIGAKHCKGNTIDAIKGN